MCDYHHFITIFRRAAITRSALYLLGGFAPQLLQQLYQRCNVVHVLIAAGVHVHLNEPNSEHGRQGVVGLMLRNAHISMDSVGD